MKPASFDRAVAEDAEHAAALLAEWDGEASILAGGQSLVPLMVMRLAVPEALVDLGRARGLDTVSCDAGGVRIGATATQARVEDDDAVAAAVPLLRTALRKVAHREIRNAGTVCGSLAHADPSAELPAVAIALDATLEVRGPKGVRVIGADGFYESTFVTALAQDELIEAVRFSRLPGGTGTAFEEVAARSGDFALVGIAAVLRTEQGRVAQACLSACGVGSIPQRLHGAEQVLRGSSYGDELLQDAASAAGREVDPPSDLHGSAAYRRAQVEVMVRRALQAAYARQGG